MGCSERENMANYLMSTHVHVHVLGSLSHFCMQVMWIDPHTLWYYRVCMHHKTFVMCIHGGSPFLPPYGVYKARFKRQTSIVS